MPKAYLKHPVKPEFRKKVLSQYPGFKLVDIKWKPEVISDGDVVIDSEKKEDSNRRTTKKSKAS